MALLVDDEPIARGIVEGYVVQLPALQCVGVFKNAVEAMTFVHQRQDELIIYLDINMPNMSGLAMAKLLSSQHQVIFTTAYSEYAVESYEYNAADYLLKPFLFERFAQASFKAIERLKSTPAVSVNSETSIKESNIKIKSDGEYYLISLGDIAHCEAQKNYTRVYMIDGRIFNILTAISKFEAELQERSELFFRVHRSFIISRQHLSSFGASHIMVNEVKIPIGSQYKELFFTRMNLR